MRLGSKPLPVSGLALGESGVFGVATASVAPEAWTTTVFFVSPIQPAAFPTAGSRVRHADHGTAVPLDGRDANRGSGRSVEDRVFDQDPNDLKHPLLVPERGHGPVLAQFQLVPRGARDTRELVERRGGHGAEI